MLEGIWRHNHLRPLYYYLYHTYMPISYVGIGAGTNVFEAPFYSAEGAQKGTIDGPSSFSLGTDPANRRSHAQLAHHGGALFFIIDDTALVCSLDVVLETFIQHEQLLSLYGLTICRDKSKIFLPSHLRTPTIIQRCKDIGISIGKLQNSTGTMTHGVVVRGIPFGGSNHFF